MNRLTRLVAPLDRSHQHNWFAGPSYAGVNKFSDEQANLLVVSLAC